jgi:hypothetical protein
MSQMAETPDGGGHGWQLILADLALILFLLTLSALPAAEARTGHRLADREARGQDTRLRTSTEIAAAQALFRPVAGGPSLTDWLASQPRDPRATLTVFAILPGGAGAQGWAAAQALAEEARAGGVAVRIIITPGDDADLYASLAYDQAVPSGS